MPRSATQTPTESIDEGPTDACVPLVRVFLLQTVRVLTRQQTIARAKLETGLPLGPVVFEPDSEIEQSWGVYLSDALVDPSNDGIFQLSLSNPTGFTQTLQAGKSLGCATEASMVEVEQQRAPNVRVLTARLTGGEATDQENRRQEKLRQIMSELDLPGDQKEKFQSFLAEHHHAFSLEDGERGETFA